MIIKKIHLTNFRNHQTYSLKCNKETTLILGKNGSGKTSVLEAIYILTQGKSFRATDHEIIKRGEEFYRIELEYDNGEKTIATYDCKIKNFINDGKKTRRLPKQNKYPIILFLPSDLNLISGSPSRHREYFDRFFGLLNEGYSNCLSKYEKALKQRNELLKSQNTSRSQLFPWDILLAKYGVKILNFRQKYTKLINNQLENTYHSIANNQDKINLLYLTEVDSTEDEYIKKLEENKQKDFILGHTSFGIHRDDYEFTFNDHPAEGSASRGESRSIILALKFVEAEIIMQELGKKPIVLLDDVFSELDKTRRQCLVKNFKNHQVIITSVEKTN